MLHSCDIVNIPVKWLIQRIARNVIYHTRKLREGPQKAKVNLTEMHTQATTKPTSTYKQVPDI